jgi:hypothetical protein
MNWAQVGPVVLALGTILLTGIVALSRELYLKNVQHDRDEAKYRESQNREDRLRREQQAREDAIRSDQRQREDQIRREQQEREDRLARERLNDWASQQWWERKAEAYSQIVEALWRSLEFANASVDYYYERMDPRFDIKEKIRTEEEKKAREAAEDKQWRIRRDRFAQDTADLKKLVGIGAFVISEEVVSVLNGYFKRIAQADDMDPVEEAEEHQRATRECLDDVREAARSDLRLLP